jgi:hypothetical protein
VVFAVVMALVLAPLYDSPNASAFSLVQANAYTPPSGLIRDPSVLRHTDGYYYLVYTTNWTGDTIGFARSTDLSAFSAKVELPGLSGVARHFTVLREDVGDTTAMPADNRSLPSANFPDRYLRHYDHKMRLDLKASTSAFASDASFTVTSPLA